MGREVRRVPKNWEHPKGSDGNYVPLFEHGGYEDALIDWENEKEYCKIHGGNPGLEPDREDYMPNWAEEEKTHFQMYETCSEGTPISPVCETPEELARWLASNKASAFAGMRASYESWLRVCKGAYAPSAVIISGVGMISGVDAVDHEDVD